MTGMASHGSSDGGKPASVAGRLGLTLFFLLFFTMGSLFELFVVRAFWHTLAQRTWKKTPCTIVSSEVQERTARDAPFAWAVSYRYTHEGQSYTNSGYRRNDEASGSYSDMQRLARKYPAGRNAFCYVNPRNPDQAVLTRDSLALGLVIPFPLIFVAIGIGGAVLIWCRPAAEAETSIAAGALRKSRKSKGKSRYLAPALFALFALVGGALAYPLGIRPITRTIAAESWVATPCQVLRAEVCSHDSDDGTTYSVYILYQYEFRGQTYKSDRYEFLGGSSSGYRGKDRVVEQYRAAAHPICYVNPDDPFDAVLKRGFHAKLLLALVPLIFLLIGVSGLIGVLRTNSPAGDGATLPPLAQRPLRASDEADLLRVEGSGRAVLAPKFSGKTKFIGMTFGALFWNVIVLVFVASIANGFQRDNPSWIGLLVLLPFVAVGLGLAGGAVYQLLALFNPRPTLELSSTVIPLGTAAELSWSFSGQARRIDEFTVTLRGVEEAKYRQGTSTCTDRNTFHETELYRTSNAGEIASGQVGFVVPPDTMHSFAAENNKILWSLDIHGSIKGWPDVKESFPITVAPVAG